MANSTQVKLFLDKLRLHLPKLQQNFRVKSLEIFGSYVRGDQTTGSDLDVLVTFLDTPSLFTFVELEDHLSELLGINVDLVMKVALKPALEERILQEAIAV